MLFALWLIWISGTESGAAQVGAFNTLEACKKAAAGAVHIGAEGSAPNYSFLCIQTRSPGTGENL
jgi:hypothetical protein